MGRWEPNAPERLQRAAFELYTAQGYDQTTVAEIAARAGLTERTFFRHFADKREVLFDGSERFRAALVDHVTAAPASATALEAVTAGIEAAGIAFSAPDLARRRQALLLANPELQERELMKLASAAIALGEALRRRGVPDTEADLAAEMGIAALRVAFARWIDDPAAQPWVTHVRSVMAELHGLTAGQTGIARTGRAPRRASFSGTRSLREQRGGKR